MSVIVRWALSNPLLTGLIATVLFLTASLGYQSVRLTVQTAALATAKADLAVCGAEKSGIALRLTSQNEAVAKAAAERLAMQSRMDDALRSIASSKAKSQAAIAKLKRAAVPADCAGAVKWGAVEGARIGDAWGSR
jgi:hypothetical protein